MHVKLKDLNPLIRTLAKKLGHNLAEIKVVAAEEVSTAYCGDAGSRGVFSLINTRTGIEETQYGSWGGANMFVECDVDQGKDIVLLGDLIALKGSTGHYNLLTLYVPPEVYATLEHPPTVELNPQEQVVMWAHRCLKGGQYRKDHYASNRINVEETVASLVGKGLLKQNKAGSTQITTEGRNAAANLDSVNINGDLLCGTK